MDKFLKSVCYFLVFLLMAVSPVMNAADPIFMGGQYHCVEVSRNKAIPDITSELLVSNMENGWYKFHWDYEDHTHFEGLASFNKQHAFLFSIHYFDQLKMNSSEQQPGYEMIQVQDGGRKLFGRFATVDHKDVGYEKCTMANTK